MNDPLEKQTGLTAEQRTERARKAANAMHAKNDSRETSANARATFLAKFASEEEKSAYFTELGRKSAESRSRRKRGT